MFTGVRSTSTCNFLLFAGGRMFKRQAEHEAGVKKPYIQCVKGKGSSFARKMELKRKGARYITLTHHLDRKVERCYPRGKAWLRMVDLHTVAWLHSK